LSKPTSVTAFINHYVIHFTSSCGSLVKPLDSAGWLECESAYLCEFLMAFQREFHCAAGHHMWHVF